MPLYWYTDKKIAGKKLKKPIPVTVKVMYGDVINVHMFGMTFSPEEKYEDITIEAFSRQIEGKIDYNDPLMKDVKEIHDKFNECIKEYLEDDLESTIGVGRSRTPIKRASLDMNKLKKRQDYKEVKKAYKKTVFQEYKAFFYDYKLDTFGIFVDCRPDSKDLVILEYETI